MSSSGAKKLLAPSCPALFRHWIDGGNKPTKSMDRGTAAHKELLGVGAVVVPIDADDWRTNVAKDAAAKAHAAGRIPMLLKDYVPLRDMVRVVRADPDAGPLFTPGVGLVERSLFWVDPEFGVWRRARLDLMIPGSATDPLIVVDFKTCTAVDEASMAASMANYGYAKQGAWYLDAAQAVGLVGRSGAIFLLVFQMTDPPYLVRVAQPTPEALQWGRVQNRKAVAVYRDCVRSGVWPGYPPGVVSLSNPRWADYQLEAAWERGDLDVSTDTEAMTG